MSNTSTSQALGIKDIRLPIRVKQRVGGIQHSVAQITLQVLAENQSSSDILPLLTNALNSFSGDFSVTGFTHLLGTLQDGFQAESIQLEIEFPYFIQKKAPVTATPSLMEYQCRFIGEVGKKNSCKLCVIVPVTTLCPCSKEISVHGAHNQRAEVTLCIGFDTFIWLEELIELVEQSASCELYALLKRPDEKMVTEQAYENPMFVEDVVRKVAEEANSHPGITWYSVGVESFESIHKHSAYAYIDSTPSSSDK